MGATVTRDDLRRAVRALGLDASTVCVHSSGASFERVEGGADAVVDAFVEEGCTLVVPTFSGSLYAVAPPKGMRPPNKGTDYDAEHPSPGRDRIYSPRSNDVSPGTGPLAVAVLSRPDRLRGDHPLHSFAAVGPRAELVLEQRPLDVHAPLRILAAREGFVALVDVGFDAMTLLHVAEERAGRAPFRRWANAPDGRPQEVEVGGCSEGFGNLEPILAPLARDGDVGGTRWRAFPARTTLEAAARAIVERPEITSCGSPGCVRCADATAAAARRR